MSRFENKRVVVTGGTSGIGRATAARLVKEGAKVLVTGTNPERLEAVRKELGVAAVENDSGNPAHADALASAVQKELGGVDAVFLNAGFGEFAPVSDVTLDSYERQFNVNLRGPLLQVKALNGLLSEGASLVFNTSVVTRMGMAGSSVYSGTKAALRNVVRVLATELAERKIRVNAVSPGPIDTNFFSRTGMPEEAIQGMAEQILAKVPLGRFGTAEDVAAVATFLLSDDAAFVTGSE
ncbi:MAG: SDR family oxidoreductase, partial [Myxococcota bacterium]